MIVFARTVKIMKNDVTRWTWYCNKTENHAYTIFGLIGPNWLKLCKLTQSTIHYNISNIVPIVTD